MRVKALQYMYYNRKEYQTGQEYDMDDREAGDAKLLELLGKIQILKAPTQKPVAAPPEYHAATIKPVEEEKHIEEEEHPLISRRRYQRRDMRADK